jgi:hypothetical protein
MLSGCSFGTKIDVEATVTAIERAPLILPPLDEVKLDTIKWRLVTIEMDNEGNEYVVFSDDKTDRIPILQALKELEEQGFDPVLFSATDEDYESMAINQAKTLKLILQQRAVIQAYKDYYILYLEETKDGDDGTDE